MICTEQERDALMALIGQYGDYSAQSEAEPHRAEYWDAASEERLDAIRAMLAPDDAVLRERIAFTDKELAVIEYVLTNAKASATGTVGEDVRKTLHRVRSVRSGEATRDDD